MKPFLRSLYVLACALPALLAGGSHAQTAYPNKPIRLIVGFPPGGTTDVLARLMAAKMSERLGQSIVVENKAGASGLIGTDFVVKSKPDGYSLLFSSSTLATYRSLYAKVPFDPMTDLEPVALVASTPYVIVVHPSLPVKTVAELVQYAKDNPGKISYAASVPGGGPHLAAELFKQKTATDMVYVPYTGSGMVMSDLISGRLQMGIDNIAVLNQHIRSGALRGIAITELTRTPLFPELPTVAADIKDFRVIGWFGIFAPAGTPAPIVQALKTAATEVLGQKDSRDRMAALGAVAESGSDADMRKLLTSEISVWSAVIRDAGIKAN